MAKALLLHLQNNASFFWDLSQEPNPEVEAECIF
jgi:hypothetical protein